MNLFHLTILYFMEKQEKKSSYLYMHVCSVVSNSLWPVDCSPPGSSVHGILQARILEWVAVPASGGSSWPRDWICISCIGRQILYQLRHKENWSGLQFPSPGNLPDPGIESASPALAGRLFTTEPPGKPTLTKSYPKFLLNLKFLKQAIYSHCLTIKT